jgi:hypothetical protein
MMTRALMFLTALAAIVTLAAATASAAPAETSGATTFTVPLTGSGGTGTASLKLNPGGKVCYDVEVTLTTAGDVPHEPAPGLGSGHIHFLSTGGIAVDLKTTFEAVGGGTFVAAGCVHDDRDLVRDILASPEDYYVNIHTVSFPGGAVSGSLG